MVTMQSSTRRFLHVANGSSVTDTIEAASIPGLRSIWADPLHDGPVPAGLSDEELLEVRVRHHAGPTDGSYVSGVNDLRSWRRIIERHEGYDELVLWFEHDLFDQLNLIQVLTWIRRHLTASKVVSLVCVGSFPGYPRFKGLGELTPGDLASLLDTRQRVGEGHYSLAERAWQAFCEPTPEALDDVRRTDTSVLPYLATALVRFLQEYPWTTDGLSRTERRLLQLAASGPIALATAFPRMHDDEDAYYVTDTSLDDLAEGLSHTSPPLLAWEVEPSPDHRLLAGSVTTTEAGQAVLGGRQDRVALCGIDRWFGGVHLQGDASLWRWDDARQRITLAR
jgi:hypothetical protein